MDGVDDGLDGGAASAEEAAVHYVDTGIEPVVDGPPQDQRAFADAGREGAGQDQSR